MLINPALRARVRLASEKIENRQSKIRNRRYFAAFCFFFASARRSVFLRRDARFLTLSLPWLFPIRPQHSPFLRRFQVVSIRPAKNLLRLTSTICCPRKYITTTKA